LTEDSGDNVAVDAFEGNNLVLVDEARGAGGFKWKKNRDQLCDRFSFEFPTFSQALKAQQAGTHGGICQVRAV